MACIQGDVVVQEALAPSIKRKRASIPTDENALGAPFTIRVDLPFIAYATELIFEQGNSLSSHDEEMSIIPQLLISRANLPLSFLAPQDEHHSVPRMFRGNLELLEAADRTGRSRQAPNVLLAVQEFSVHTTYAIEKVARGVYALCRLANWVRLEDFEDEVYWAKKAKRISGDVREESILDHMCESQSSVRAKLQRGSKVSSDYRRIPSQRVRLFMKPPYGSVCAEKKTQNTLEEKTQKDSSLDQSVDMLHSLLTESVHQESFEKVDPVPVANLDEVLDNLKRQYLEALYNSKASLAYFAKGPLSRPRGLLLLEYLSKPSYQEISEALRSCVLSRNMLDTKYSSAVPDLVKDLPLGVASDDEACNIHVSSQSKSRKSQKRKKIRRNGLFPGEEESIKRWYARTARAQVDDVQNLSREERVRSAIAIQRSRETQMQIALILEIIALERTSPSATNAESTIPVQKAGQDDPVPKAKKSQNLLELLDVLVERLCIWQSTDLDLNELPKVKTDGTSTLEQQSDSSRKSDNGLEDFCTQVIIPFYASRLPDLSASIRQSLGGVNSPKRPSFARTTSRTKLKDVETTRNQQLKRRKTLERVLTDDKLTRQGPIASLIRSNTDSAVPRIKRETSEISLGEVPPTKGLKAIPRQYSQREVDLSAVSRVTEARLQRKQLIEQEKNAAIALLKKPNARMAVMDLMESRDQREAGAKARSRKSKNPIRNIFTQGVQVMATPQTNRHKNAFQPLPKLIPTRFEPSPDPDVIPPSSDPKVPSSSIKPIRGEASHSQRTPIKGPASTSTIQLQLEGVTNSSLLAPRYDTPARKLSRFAMPRVPLSVVEENVERRGCAETPSRGKDAKRAAQTLSKARQPMTFPLTPSRTAAGKTVASTPLASSKASGKVVASTPSKGQMSIYESLGWDNDDVDGLI